MSKSFAYFLTEFLVFLMSYKSSLCYIYLYIHMHMYIYIFFVRQMFCKYFFPFCSFLFHFLNSIFLQVKVLTLKSNSYIFLFAVYDYVLSKNLCLAQGHKYFLLRFLLKSFIVLVSMFRSIIYFEFLCVYGLMKGPRFIFPIQISSYFSIIYEKTILSPSNFYIILENQWTVCNCCPISGLSLLFH